VQFTDYNTCIKWLFDLERAGVKYDLNNITAMLDFLGNPQDSFKSIHVAGTNGKGTVVSIINSMLMEAGKKCGLYTSPHILDFRERVVVNGRMISKKFVVEFTNRLLPLIEKIQPSFYEVNTAMAFEYFRMKKVEYAVVETGLGGRLDSTNVVNPIISIITSIAIEHTEYLGDTIEKIAFEKAGIIKEGKPVVTGKLKPEALRVVKERAEELNAPLTQAKDRAQVEITDYGDNCFYFDLKTSDDEIDGLKFPVQGDYQKMNIATAYTAMEIISENEGIKLTNKIIKKGFTNLIANSLFHGRFQLIRHKPKIILDVSHNPQALSNLKESLKNVERDKLYILFGLLKDKDHKACIEIMEKLNAEIVLTKPNYKRAVEPKVLYELAGNKNKFVLKPDFKEAVDYLRSKLQKNDLLLVTGSFFMVSDFMRLVNRYYKWD
jgi:dihydrofolate synthase / folylpolyglutamate synthase